MVLSSKVNDKELIILDELKISEPKTKIMVNIINKIFKQDKRPNILLVISKKDENLIKASRNIPKTKTILANSLNALDLLSFKYLLIDKEGVKVIEKTYGNI